MESLQLANNDLSEEIQGKNQFINRLEQRVQSLLDDKETMERLMRQIEEEHSNNAMEAEQLRTDEALRDEISSEKQQLGIKIADLEFQKTKVEDTLAHEMELKEELFGKITLISEEFEQFKNVSVSRVKFEESQGEVADLRDKANALESTARFREMKIKELEGKAEALDGRLVRQRNQSKARLEERLEETQKRLQGKIAKLKESIEALEVDNKRLRRLQGDPEYVSKIELELETYKTKEAERMGRLEKITSNFKALEEQITKEKMMLTLQLDQRKKQVGTLEQELFGVKRNNKILMSETQSISRRSISRVGNSGQLEAKKYIDQFLKVNAENQNLKMENGLLSEEIVFLQKRHMGELGVLYSSLVEGSER